MASGVGGHEYRREDVTVMKDDEMVEPGLQPTEYNIVGVLSFCITVRHAELILCSVGSCMLWSNTRFLETDLCYSVCFNPFSSAFLYYVALIHVVLKLFD